MLETVTQEQIEKSFPDVVKNASKEIRERMEASFKLLEKSKTSNISRAKRYYDRKLKKCEYKIGDLVLCNHPKVKKGMARGLAPKYHGPFVVVGKHINKCNYLIKSTDTNRARAKVVHVTNLKTYYKRGEEPDKIAQSSTEIEQTQPTSRPYKKNPNNPRWKAKDPQDVNESESSSSESGEESEPGKSYDADASIINELKENDKVKVKRGRPKGSRNKPKETKAPIVEEREAIVTKSGRKVIPQLKKI